jgi:DnaK suppressor protein
MSVPELDHEQLEELHRDLLADRLHLEEHLQLSEEGAKPVQLGTPIGRLSRMDAIQQQEMTKASRSTNETKLRQIKASLEAHQKGEYGYCRSCESPIGYRRLKARPEAPFCLRCQDSREA